MYKAVCYDIPRWQREVGREALKVELAPSVSGSHVHCPVVCHYGFVFNLTHLGVISHSLDAWFVLNRVESCRCDSMVHL